MPLPKCLKIIPKHFTKKSSPFMSSQLRCEHFHEMSKAQISGNPRVQMDWKYQTAFSWVLLNPRYSLSIRNSICYFVIRSLIYTSFKECTKSSSRGDRLPNKTNICKYICSMLFSGWSTWNRQWLPDDSNFGFHFEFFVLSGNASANFIEAISILLLLTINYDNRSRFPLMEKK